MNVEYRISNDELPECRETGSCFAKAAQDKIPEGRTAWFQATGYCPAAWECYNAAEHVGRLVRGAW